MSDRDLTIRFEGGPFDGLEHTASAGSPDEIFGRGAKTVQIEDGENVYELKDATDDVQTYTLKA